MPSLDATVTWKQEMLFEGKGSASGFPVHMDSDPDAGGKEHGARPMEVLLIALGGCTGMDVISILEKMRQDVTHYEVRLHGERAADHPMRYISITVEHVVHGRNLKPETVKRAVELSETKYCSVAATLLNGATVRHQTTIVDDEKAA